MASKRDSTSGSLFARDDGQMAADYYSRDVANPGLQAFIQRHVTGRPVRPDGDEYECKPLLRSSKVKRSTKIFNMHTYWSKKPHESVDAFVSHYTKPGDIVLDPFCGSGGTLLVSCLSGRHAVGIDLSPAATFFSAVLCNPPELRQFETAFNDIISTLRAKYGWVYEYPYRNKLWPIHFGISSMRFKCIRCLKVSSLYRCGGDEEGALCPSCKERIKSTQEKLGYQLDEWHLTKGRGDHYVVLIDGALSDFEADIQKRIGDALAIHRPPVHQFPRTGRTQVLAVRGIKSLIDLYTPRNLLALALYRDECLAVSDERLRNALLFCLTACCLKASRMMGYNSDGIGRIQKNGLIAQLIVKDVNVFDFLEIAHKGIAAGFADIHERRTSGGQVALSTQSACDLSALPSQSIDYVFTDPPYGYRVQFWESNQVWEAWLGLDTNWHDREVIVNPVRGLDESHWESLFRKAMQECYRILKPGRWITLTYNDRDTWPLLQNVMLETGFLPDQCTTAVRMETTAKSEKQLKGEDNTLRDLVVNFRKPRPDEIGGGILIDGKEDDRTYADKVRAIVRSYLDDHPGSSKDSIHDEVVSRMVRAGALEAHDFDEILSSVSEEVKTPVRKDLFRKEDPNLFGKHEVGRWYLKEGELEITDAAESAKEDDAAKKLTDFIKAQMKKYAETEGVHYSDLFEQYVYAVRDKPRRYLAEFLPDYFFKTENGSWRPPVSEEESRAKAESRTKGTGRRVKRYIALLERGVAIPDRDRPNDASLAEWIRHCKRAGLYDQGKLLYEKGGLNLDKLPEEVMVGVEEDYQVCMRMLARNEGAKPARKRKGAKA